jgi:NADH:ubiquinone oxidoreductase subunit 6 (subunit J)
MILEILSVGLIFSACLALFLHEAVYSVAALAGTFLFTALLYALNGAPYAAIFQFAVGIGTLAILFLSGEMLTEESPKKTSPKRRTLILAGSVVLSLLPIFLSVPSEEAVYSNATFGDALWDLNGFDVVLQALVILTIALGIAIILANKEKREK